jgi:hypothetical protein
MRLLLVLALFLSSGGVLPAKPTLNKPAVEQGATRPNDKPGGGKQEIVFWRKALADPTAVFTLALAVFTGGLFVYTVKLWGETKNSAERQQRAYVGIHPSISRPEHDFRMMVAIADATNHGQTTAYHVLTAERLEYKPIQFRPPDDLPVKPSTGVLSPTGFFQLLPDPVRLTTEEITALRTNQESRLYFYGVVIYEDAFRKRWRQRFCFYIDWTRADGKMGIEYCDSWNDEVCIGGQSNAVENLHRTEAEALAAAIKEVS